MHFGKKLLEKQYAPWSKQYVDYALLKDILERDASASVSRETHQHQQQHQPQHPPHQQHQPHHQPQAALLSQSSSASLRHSQRHTTLSFQVELDHQVRKVVLFFLQQQGSIAHRIHRLNSLVEHARGANFIGAIDEMDVDGEIDENDEDGDDLQQLQKLLLKVSLDLHHLIEFVDLNVTGIRKILKKHDRILMGRRSLSERYLVLPSSRYRVELSPLLEYGGLDVMIGHLGRLWEVWEMWEMHAGSVEPTSASSTGYGMDAGDALLTDGTSILSSIHSARETLQKTSAFVDMLAAQMLIEEETSSQKEKVHIDRRVSNWLNYCSTFLHLTDYYVVAPGCSSYATLMGGDESLAGVIIGMNSNAALISTLIYSWWSSWSYRGPLLCATCCQILGQVIYALALPLGGGVGGGVGGGRGLQMVMIGRLLSGFGSARALNRRYIADTYSRSERTAASAAFVTAGALGTSAGPALAAGLYSLTTSEGSEENESLFWRPENAPSFVMAMVWCVYLVLVFVYFVEPEHPKYEGNLSSKPSRIELSVHNNEEHRRLLSDQTEASNKTTSSEANTAEPLWKIIPVMLTFLIYFVLKFILESLLSSTAVLTDYYFDWNDAASGSYLAMLGLLVLPANWIVAWVAQRYDDRELIVAIELIMLFGCLSILDYTKNTSYSSLQYMLASITIFVSTNALEGPTMSLLSKSIPPYYRRGFWNVGLLATESGTLGRAVGDVILTMCGSAGLQYILNNAFGAMSVLSMVTILVTVRFYGCMEPSGEKDD